MRAVLIAALAALSLAAATAGSAVSAPRALAVEIAIDNFTFAPGRVTVAAGTRVTWVNRDDIPHTVVAVTRSFKSRALDTGDTFSFEFSVPGTYDYFCSLHPHMTGTVVVEAAPEQN
jgi:plastocyanin